MLGLLHAQDVPPDTPEVPEVAETSPAEQGEGGEKPADAEAVKEAAAAEDATPAPVAEEAEGGSVREGQPAKSANEDPGYYDKRDLIAQQAMARAAEEMVNIGWAQVIIGAVTIIGLVFTLYYTRVTANEAIRSASAAEKSADVALGVAIARPIVTKMSFQEGHETMQKHVNKRKLLLHIQNLGETTGIIQLVRVGVTFGSLPPEPLYDQKYHFNRNNVLEPKAWFTFDKWILPPNGERWTVPLKDETRDVWVYGVVEFLDVFGERRGQRFCGKQARGLGGASTRIDLGGPPAYTHTDREQLDPLKITQTFQRS